MKRSTFEVLHLATQAVRKAIGEEHLTLSQATVLRAIRNAKKPPSQTDLVNATGIDRSTLADVLRRLIRAKLVSRRRNRLDAREYIVQMTADGGERLNAFELAERKASKEISEALASLNISVGTR